MTHKKKTAFIPHCETESGLDSCDNSYAGYYLP